MNPDIERLCRAAAEVKIAGVPGDERYEEHIVGSLPEQLPIVRAILSELRKPSERMDLAGVVALGEIVGERRKDWEDAERQKLVREEYIERNWPLAPTCALSMASSVETFAVWQAMLDSITEEDDEQG